MTRADLPSDFSGAGFVRRDDLLKPDVMSEVILLGAGALVFAILILILVVVLTQASAPIRSLGSVFQNPQSPLATMWLRHSALQAVF